MSGSDWIEKVGPVNLTPEEADTLVGEVSGLAEQYEVQEHPKAPIMQRIERKLHAAIKPEDPNE